MTRDDQRDRGDRRRRREGDERCPPAAPGSTSGLVKQSPHPNADRRRRRCMGFRAGQHEASITSTMRPVNRSPTATVGLTEQAAGAIRRAITDGEAAQGERLPPAKDIAAVLGVNRNTVLSALRTLRDEGLVDFRRGRGVLVAATPQRSEITDRARDLVHFARTRGYEPDELVQIIRTVS